MPDREFDRLGCRTFLGLLGLALLATSRVLMLVL
jgi:hypothetical protein